MQVWYRNVQEIHSGDKMVKPKQLYFELLNTVGCIMLVTIGRIILN
jgi:hypothetical protein